MAVKRLFNDRPQFFDGNGNPLSGGKLFFYAAGSSTKQSTFTTSAGLVANSNPVVLDSTGRPPAEIWLTVGQSYKVVLASSTDSDPPTAPLWSEDNVTGLNDATLVIDEWISGPAPTYVSATSFTVAGDQTSILTVGRRVKITDAGGTKYGTIKTSVFGTLTTVTLDSQDSDALASPTTALSYGILNPANTSHPVLSDALALVGGSSDRSKRIRIETDGNTTGTTRVGTWLDYDFRFMSQTKGADIDSASTINLDTATGDLVDVTGTAAISAITLAEGKMATVRFTGTLTLTNGASLVLPGGANITTAAGDFAIFRGYAAGIVRCVSYVKADGTPVVNANGTTITLGTEQATTSGTAIDFTSIPSWVKRITVMFEGVSTSGTSIPIIQIGDSGGIETTGYVSNGLRMDLTNTAQTAGYALSGGWAATLAVEGHAILTLKDSTNNTWTMHSVLTSATDFHMGGGNKSLSATLDRLRITTVGGSDTFDAGSINISWE